jgi:beta-1,4-mannosyltransferase
VAVVVVGDLGRSPRMLFHALALAEHGAQVELIGVEGSALPREIVASSRIRVHAFPASPGGLRSPRGLLLAARRLDGALEAAGALDLVLVQNPPSLPSLRVVGRFARRRGIPWVIDWHNLGFAMLALRTGRSSPLVAAVRALERIVASSAKGHLCVSAALRDDLSRRWGLDAAVLYDRPAALIVAARGAAAAFRTRLADRLSLPDLATGERLLVASATSWTADEDFRLLLAALRELEPAAPVAVVVSGRGEGRVAFERAAAGFLAAGAGDPIALRTLWLEPEEYPLFLAAADVGLCLHRSATGLDLPMKLADLRGAAVPTLAFDYGPVLRERFTEGRDGWLFANAASLAMGLRFLLEPGGLAEARRLRAALRDPTTPQRTFSHGWRDEALPLLLRLGLGAPA